MSTRTLHTVSPRPFLKWAGGKSQLIQQYTPYFPKNFQTYYESFLGGGAVFFHLYAIPSASALKCDPSAFLTDVNPELVNVYRCVRDSVEEIIQLLEQHQQNHNHDYYYQVRSCAEGTETEKAARLIYLNKTCFNGLYRENTKGEFNVPIGRYQNPKICDPDLLHSASAALQLAEIAVRPFEAILNYAKSDQDFVYFDPPYYPLSSTSNFTAYNRYSFSKDDQIKLQATFAALAKRGVKVMLSNSDCSLIRELYSDFKIHPISASRAINSDAKKRGRINEVLVTSY
jgi:DNA adenine methylase